MKKGKTLKLDKLNSLYKEAMKYRRENNKIVGFIGKVPVYRHFENKNGRIYLTQSR